jgi:glycosyltransferase involved in cell wall biosynthesis
MRILFVISELPPTRSGVARIGAQLVSGYCAAGHQVAVLERREVGSLTLGEARLSGLALHWPKVARLLEHCDLVHLHGPAPTFADAFLAAYALRRRRPPLLYSHNFELHFPGPLAPLGRLYELLTLRLALRVARAIVVSTEQFRSRLPDPGRIVVVPWGCDHRPEPIAQQHDDADSLADEELHTRDDHPLRVLFVGQMRPYKGVPVLLDALWDLPGIEAKLAGDGRRLEAYRRRLARREAQGGASIELLGPVDDARLDQLYGWADVVVLPSVSRQEAFGLVLLEGMRAGCVPVASRLPGVSEVVGDAGVLVEPGDAAGLRAALAALRDDGERRAELAARARRRASERTWERSVARHLELVQKIVEEAGLARAAAEASHA